MRCFLLTKKMEMIKLECEIKQRKNTVEHQKLAFYYKTPTKQPKRKDAIEGT